MEKAVFVKLGIKTLVSIVALLAAVGILGTTCNAVCRAGIFTITRHFLNWSGKSDE